MPKPKPKAPQTLGAIEGDELSQTADQLAMLEQKAIERFGRLALRSGLADYAVTNAQALSAFGDFLAKHKTTKPRTTPLLRTRQSLARLKRKAAHKKKRVQTKDKREKIKKGEWRKEETDKS